MKRLIMLSAMFLLSTLLALPVLANGKGAKNSQPAVAQKPKLEHAKDVDESEAFKRQQTYFQKREAMKQRRDEALKLRESNVKTNNPGHTGL